MKPQQPDRPPAQSRPRHGSLGPGDLRSTRWSVIAGVWGTDWKELTPYDFGALFMFGAGSIVTGQLGDLWGRCGHDGHLLRRHGRLGLVIALCSNKWQIGVALTLMGAFASIYHPVGIPMLVQKAKNPGFTIGVNGLVGNLGIAIGAGLSVLLAQRFGWQMAFIVPGVICLVCAVAFVVLVPREEEAPAKRKAKMLDLPPSVMARVFVDHDLHRRHRQHHLQLHHQRQRRDAEASRAKSWRQIR